MIVVITKILTHTGHSLTSTQQDLDAQSFHLQPRKMSLREKKSCRDCLTTMVLLSCCTERGQVGEGILKCGASAMGTLLQITRASEEPILDLVVFQKTSLKPSRHPTDHTCWWGESY